MRFSTAAATLAVSATVAQALSTGCTTQVASLALGDLGSCLQLTNLLPVLSASGSIISPLNTYLGSLCGSSTPTCSNSTLSSAQSSLSSACSSDLSGGGTTAGEVQLLLSALNSYPQFYAGACAKNSTSGDYCLTSTLNTVQSDVGSDISLSFLTSLTSGNNQQLTQALNSGNLCTGCVSTIYQQAVSANASIANTSPAQALKNKCGSSFGTSSGTSGVSAVSSAASSTGSAASSASSSAASTSRSAGEAVRSISSFAPIAAAGVAMLGAVALGGAVVL